MPDKELFGTLNAIGFGDALLLLLSFLCILAVMRNKLAKIFPNSKFFSKISDNNEEENCYTKQHHDDITLLINAVSELKNSTVDLSEKIDRLQDRYYQMEENIQLIKDEQISAQRHMSDLENTIQSTASKCDFLITSDKENKRSYFVEKFNEFVQQKKEIDIYSLSVLEKHYDVYLKENGNSFVGTIMHRIRALPVTFSEQEEHDD